MKLERKIAEEGQKIRDRKEKEREEQEKEQEKENETGESSSGVSFKAVCAPSKPKRKKIAARSNRMFSPTKINPLQEWITPLTGVSVFYLEKIERMTE